MGGIAVNELLEFNSLYAFFTAENRFERRFYGKRLRTVLYFVLKESNGPPKNGPSEKLCLQTEKLL